MHLKCSKKDNLHKSCKQSSFFFKRSLISPDMSTEYGHAISFKKPLISSWKLSRSSLPLKKENHKTFSEYLPYTHMITSTTN